MKIAILGASRSSRDSAPFDDRTWEIWACSSGTIGVPRVDLHFEIHNQEQFLAHQDYGEYMKCLPVMMQKQDSEYPYSLSYPLEEMLAEFGPHFFSSSISYMLALAISKKPDLIGLWGVDMMADDEYEYQRPGCFRFIEIAKERGIDVTIAEGSGLLIPSKLYGYETGLRTN